MHSFVRRTLAAAAAAGVLGVVTATGASAAPEVELSFTPATGPAGTTITVTGQCPDGYTEAAGVLIGREDGEDAMNDSEADVAEDGSFTAEVVVRTTTAEAPPKAGDELLVVGVCLAYDDDEPAWGAAARTFSVTAGSTGSGGGTPRPGVEGPALPGASGGSGGSDEPTVEAAAAELPRTGGASWQIAVAGGALVAGGSALVVAARRRQVGQPQA